MMKKLNVIFGKSLLVAMLVMGMLLVGTGCAKKEAAEETATKDAVEAVEETTEGNTEEVAEDEVAEEAATEAATEEVTEEVVEETSMMDGIFTYTIINEGTEYVSLINFYENGMYYFSQFNNAQYRAGYYEVDENPVDMYTVGGVSGEKTEATVTCDAKITFYDMDGTAVVAEAGYLNDGTVIGLTFQDSRDFGQVLDSGHTSEDEVGINVAEFYVENDDYSYVALKHNGTFEDTVDAMITGKWTVDGTNYTLTDDDTQGTYTLTDNGDGTALYTSLNAKELTLFGIMEAEIVLVLEGKIEATYGEMVGVLNLREDQTGQLIITYASREVVTDGTWSMADGYTHLNLSFEGVDYEAPMDFETQTFSWEYPVNDGAEDTVLLLGQ